MEEQAQQGHSTPERHEHFYQIPPAIKMSENNSIKCVPGEGTMYVDEDEYWMEAAAERAMEEQWEVDA